jgi:hypothetical protein
MARRIEVQLLGDSRSLERAFRNSSDAGGKWGKRIGMAAKTGGLAVVAGVGLAAVALKKSVDAAKEAEVSQLRMRAQLKASGISWANHRDQIDRVITAQSRLSALDDEDLQDSFTNLVRVTGNVTKALKLNALAADFARAKSIPVAKAGELIGKVAGGNLGILSRYGITLKEGATATEALGVLQKKFGGQAKAYGDSTAGAQEKFGVALENLQEKIGEKFLPLATKLFNWGTQFISWAERNWPKFQAVAGRAFEVIKAKGQELLNWFNANLMPTIQAIVEGARAFWERFGDDVKRNFRTVVAIVRNTLDNVKQIVNLVLAVLRGDWGAAWNALKNIARNVLQTLVAMVKGFKDNFLTAAKALGGAIKDGIVAGVRGLASVLADVVRGAINAVLDRVRGFGIPGFTVPLPGPDFRFGGAHPFAGLPQLATGGTIARSGVAVVHRGESVIPARVNRADAGGSGHVWIVGRGDMAFARAMQALNTSYARGNGGRSLW